MASSSLLLSDGGKLLLSDGSSILLSSEYDEVTVSFSGGGKRTRTRLIPVSMRIKISSNLYVKNNIIVNIKSKLTSLSVIKVSIISPLITSLFSKIKLHSRLLLREKENFNVKGIQSYKEFYRTIKQLEEMV